MDWFKIGKEVRKAVYCHPTYLIYMQSISCEIYVYFTIQKEKKKETCPRSHSSK